MVISFERHLKRKQEKEAYRLELIAKIVERHAALGQELSDSYLEHLKLGFPIEILESIVQKLDQDQAAQHS